MPKKLDDEQLDDVFDAEADDDFGSGIDDTPSKKSPPASESAEDIDPEEEVEPEAVDDTPDEPGVSVRDLVSKHGFNLEGDDDAEALDKLLGNVAQYVQRSQQERQQAQRQAEEIRQYQYQLAQFRQEQQQKPAQQPAVPQSLTGLLKHFETIPEWNENWRKLVKQDENGEWVAKPGADPMLPQKMAERIEWEERAQRAFFENPQQFILEATQANPAFQAAIQQQIQQQVYQVQDAIEAQRVADQMRPYITNQDGSLNEAGNAYANAVQYAQSNLGVYDTARLHQIALQAALPYIQQKAAQQQVPPETPSETKKKKQLQFAKTQAEKTKNKSRKKTPARALGDADGMTRHALQQMRDAGIDPNALAGVR